MSDELQPEENQDELLTVADVLDGEFLSDAERERDEFKDALQRLQADFENYRKRVARTAEDVTVRASAEVVNKLLKDQAESFQGTEKDDV
ncbi:MAG: nucleotide exchange factor GrpE, partial [Actinomycetes bacterium]